MNPLQQLTDYVVQPPLITSLPSYFMAVAWLLLPWLLFLWVFAALVQLFFPTNREQYGASVAIRLSYAWSAVCVATILVVDVAVLFILSRIPGWTSVTPHVTYIFVGMAFAFIYWNGLRGDLRMSQVPLRRAQHGART